LYLNLFSIFEFQLTIASAFDRHTARAAVIIADLSVPGNYIAEDILSRKTAATR
jgi:hypothetical protein